MAARRRGVRGRCPHRRPHPPRAQSPLVRRRAAARFSAPPPPHHGPRGCGRGGWPRGVARPGGRACRLRLVRGAPPGGGGVLREEVLIHVAVVGGSALLSFGFLDFIWPSTPRHPVRRPQPAGGPPPTPTKTVT